MLKNNLLPKFIFYTTFVVLLTFGLTASLQSFLNAWTEPTADPPNGGVSTAGGKFVDGAVAGEIYYDGGYVGINTNDPSVRLEVSGDVKATAFYYDSDQNLKKDIKQIDNALEKVEALEGVFFKWKNNDSKENLGLIAQAVEEVFPEAVHTSQTDGLKSVEYGNLIAPVIEAVKDLSEQNKALLESNSKLQAQIDSLQAQIKNLKN